MTNKGILLVISGFSGAGKGTLVKKLLEKYDNYGLSVSATTRAPREGEVDGREYFFKTREEFEQMIREDALIEHACYVGNYYGTPRAYVEKQVALGKDVILEIEIQGARNIKRQFPDAVLLFVTPPSAEELRSRLIGRGSETTEVVNGRLKRAAEEAEGIEDYDYFVCNDDLDACTEEIHHIVQCEKCRTARRLSDLEQIRSEVKKLADSIS